MTETGTSGPKNTSAKAKPSEKTLKYGTSNIFSIDDMPRPMNATQVNIVSVVDVNKALTEGSLSGNIYMMDNTVDLHEAPSAGCGTDHLVTNCSSGSVLNWLIYSVGGTVTPQITDIEFPNHEICLKLQAYGAPDVTVSPSYIPGKTPWYYYWAGMLMPHIPAGQYAYRLEMKLGDMIYSLETPSINVIAYT